MSKCLIVQILIHHFRETDTGSVNLGQHFLTNLTTKLIFPRNPVVPLEFECIVSFLFSMKFLDVPDLVSNTHVSPLLFQQHKRKPQLKNDTKKSSLLGIEWLQWRNISSNQYSSTKNNKSLNRYEHKTDIKSNIKWLRLRNSSKSSHPPRELPTFGACFFTAKGFFILNLHVFL